MSFASDAEKINKAAAFEIFSSDGFWNETVEHIASRLERASEYKVGDYDFINKYMYKKKDIFGTHPYTLNYELKNGKLTAIRLCYGDYSDYYKRNKQKIERERKKKGDNYYSGIEDDKFKIISKTLSSNFGPHEITHYGFFKKKAFRWVCGDVEFILISSSNDLVTLNIYPLSKAPQPKQGDIKIDTSKKVIKNENRDVLLDINFLRESYHYLDNAIYNSIFLYYGVKIDENDLNYIRARWGDEEFECLKKLAFSKNLKVKKTKLNLSTIAGLINKGIPIVWKTYITEEVGKFISERSKARENTPIDSWKKECAKEKWNKMKMDSCYWTESIIIGYNLNTKELAIVSRSYAFDDRDEIKWVPFEAAKEMANMYGSKNPLTTISP